MGSTGVRGRWAASTNRVADRLVRECTLARSHGVDFPTVWATILQPSRLTVGRPIQAFVDGRPVLQVRLVTNEYIVCGPYGYALK
jgi:hypothetical protein